MFRDSQNNDSANSGLLNSRHCDGATQVRSCSMTYFPNSKESQKGLQHKFDSQPNKDIYGVQIIPGINSNQTVQHDQDIKSNQATQHDQDIHLDHTVQHIKDNKHFQEVQDDNDKLKFKDQISKLADDELISETKNLVKSERKIMHLVLWHIQQIDQRRLYLKLGFTSLYQYLTQELGYAENAAYDRMQAARLLIQNPEISSQVESGALNLSQLVKVSASLKQEHKAGKVVSNQFKQDLFKQIEKKTKFETEQVLAQVFDHIPEQIQKIKPQQDGSVVLQVTLSKEQYEILKQVQSAVSHSVPDQNIADVFSYLAKFYLKKVNGKKSGFPDSSVHSVLRDADKKNVDLNSNNNRAVGVKIKSTKPLLQNVLVNEEGIDSVTDISSIPTKIQIRINSDQKMLPATQSFLKKPFEKTSTIRSSRKYISVHVKRSLFQKANYSCEYFHTETRQRCCSQYQLQLDHIQPLAFGGSSDLQNLRVLCGVHNRAEANHMQLIL